MFSLRAYLSKKFIISKRFKTLKIRGGEMKKNLSKGEMVFRVMFGVLIAAVTFLPAYGNYVIWVLAAIMVITGIMLYCPVCQIIDKH